MARLANGQYVYRNDLGGLCNICNEYFYKVFDTFISLIQLNIANQEEKNKLITELEKLRIHLRRGFEEELIMNQDGTTIHVDTINHCLLYAFGECHEQHTNRYAVCDQLFEFIKHFMTEIKEHYSTIEKCQDKLYYFLAHQARKVYLNNQFKARLAKLDNNGAILVCDYKMRILPKSARETKEQFFGKRGWSLHTILVFTKNNTDQLNIQVFDHWSTDTKQDAWFTISSFDFVFETLDPKPQWIEILSDNGAHYHNSELIVTIANWYEWYNIEIRGWYFLEPGEAKTSVDSHHAQIAHAIKRYVRIGHNLDEGEKIQVAIADLGGTSVANLEPIRNNHNIKTITGITQLFYFEWPINSDYMGYIQARCLPHIGS
ncbi:hypothetical protein Glove_219g106 [Diversispora epigaea]|uniref:Uncharacterized protein n=1 Tax=Diversispora epigaea TaxID=1348612 RepID=A0A397INR0_9GLOM|nr:hypothetical protein Glove_219g106 [Diversispora epigaea]